MRCLIVIAVLSASAAEAGRVCQAPGVPATEIAGHSPREVRAALRPLLGAPLVETNQLPDGGAFAKLAEADLQDGVSQHYAWGGDSGSLDVTFNHGRAANVELHLSEFETTQAACLPWARDRLAAAAGVKLARFPNGGTARLFRFDLGHGLMVRARCNEGSAHGLCTALDIYVTNPAMPAPVIKSSVVQAAPSAPHRVLHAHQ